MATAAEFIREATATAPVNVERLIRSFNIKLDKKAELHSDVAGEIARSDAREFTISVNADDHYYRQRFTMAHELAHYLFHRDLIGTGVDDNRAYRSVAGGNFFNPNVTAEHEIEANRFAAGLLMPAKLVRSEFDRCGENLELLSNKFQVSQEAMRYRIQSLGLVAS
jgi:Zn-dependent peptidase ImmA (M78 family)